MTDKFGIPIQVGDTVQAYCSDGLYEVTITDAHHFEGQGYRYIVESADGWVDSAKNLDVISMTPIQEYLSHRPELLI